MRAAGAATGRNPLSIFIPCHRIVGADGALTGYAGGLDRKRALLALERGVAHGEPAPAAAPARRAASKWPGATDMRRADIERLFALAAIWGASFIFIRVLSPALGPVLTVVDARADRRSRARRLLRVAGVASDLGRYWRQYLVIGVVNSTLPFMLYAFAALHIPASYSVILNSTTPLFTALLAVPWLGERLTWAKSAVWSPASPESCS